MTASVLAEPKPRWPTMWCSWTGRNSAKSDVAAHGDAATERGVSCDTDRIPDSSNLVTPATVIVSPKMSPRLTSPFRLVVPDTVTSR